MTAPPSNISSGSASDLVGWLSVEMWGPTLSPLLDRLETLPDPLRIPLLAIVFETEVVTSGILGFIQNSAGLYLVETIDALEVIDARKKAAALRVVRTIMAEHAVTVEQLRSNVNRGELFEVTNFVRTHGEGMSTMTTRIQQETRSAFYSPEEDIFELVETYVDLHREKLIEALARV